MPNALRSQWKFSKHFPGANWCRMFGEYQFWSRYRMLKCLTVPSIDRVWELQCGGIKLNYFATEFVRPGLRTVLPYGSRAWSIRDPFTRLEKCRPGHTHELLELRGKSCIWSSLRSLDKKFGSRTKNVNKPPPRWRKPFQCINFRENQSETIVPPSQEFRKCRTVYRVGGDRLWGFGLLFSRKRRRNTINLEKKTVASSPWEFNNGGKDLCVQYIPNKVQPISILPSKLFFSALSGKPLLSFVSHDW